MGNLPKRALSPGTSIFIFLLGFALMSIAAAILTVKPVQGQEEQPGDPARGGRLYVAWDLVDNNINPRKKNPLWPTNTSNTVPFGYTWRCVNCHSWDYTGSSSATQSNLFQNLDYPNLFNMMGKNPEEILTWLNGEENSLHDFSDYLTGQDMNDLSAFLSMGLVTPDLIANVETRSVSGTLSVGEESYNEFCSSCHGSEGEKINFGTTQTPTFMGDLALSNPWRVAHTIRYGHLTSRMPAADVLGLAFSQQIDILAYTQTLPTATIIIDPAFQNIDYASQASTDPLAIGAMILTLLVFGAVLITVRVRNQ